MHVYNKSYMQIITSIKHIMLNKQYIYIMLLNNNYSNIYLYMLVSKSSTNGWWTTVLWWHAEIYTNLYIWVIMGVSKKWVPQTVGFPMY